MKTKLLFLTVLGAAILGANAYFLPTLSQDVALDSVNSSMQTWRAYLSVSPLIGILELFGLFSAVAYLLFSSKSK